MAATQHLLACPYAMQAMAALGGVWGRSRFMGLAAGAEVPAHIDANYYWRTHLRIHVPVVTNPGVVFTCGTQSVHMAAGECWAFDSFLLHDVQNKGPQQRVHLVIDSVVTERLWDLIDRSLAEPDGEAPLLAPSGGPAEELRFERINRPKVMSPWEMKVHVAFLADHVAPDPKLGEVMRRLERFICAWQGVWAEGGDSDESIPVYRGLVAEVRQDLHRIGGAHIAMENGEPLYYFLDQLVFIYALAPARQRAAVAAAGQRLAS
jgi:hypothetical protein